MCRLIVRAVNVCGVFCVVSVLWCCLMGRHRVARHGVVVVYYCPTALHRASRAAGVSVVCWRTTCVAVDYRTHVPMATDGLRNELMQVCNGWWRLQQCRGWKVSCLFVVYFFSACSRRQRVLCSACFLGCDAAPRGGIACLAAVWLGCGTASRHGIGHSCRRRVCGMMAHRMCGR